MVFSKGLLAQSFPPLNELAAQYMRTEQAESIGYRPDTKTLCAGSSCIRVQERLKETTKKVLANKCAVLV